MLAVPTEAKGSSVKEINKGLNFLGHRYHCWQHTGFAWLNANEDGLREEGSQPNQPEKLQVFSMQPGVESRAVVLTLMTKISDLAEKPWIILTPIIRDVTSLIANSTHSYIPSSMLMRCSCFTTRSKGVWILILILKPCQQVRVIKIAQARIQLKDIAHSQCIHWGKWKSLWKHTIISYLGTVRGWGWPRSCLPWSTWHCPVRCL